MFWPAKARSLQNIADTFGIPASDELISHVSFIWGWICKPKPRNDSDSKIWILKMSPFAQI